MTTRPFSEMHPQPDDFAYDSQYDAAVEAWRQRKWEYEHDAECRFWATRNAAELAKATEDRRG